MKRICRRPKSIRFRRWSRKPYAAFVSIGRHVTMGQVCKGIADASLDKGTSLSALSDDEIVSLVGRKGGLDRDESIEAARELSLERLVGLASAVTVKCAPRKFDTCSIINAKSGRCPEDCKWCAQSAHYGAHADEYPLVAPESILAAAIRCKEKGIGRFSIVTSGKKLAPHDVDSVCLAARLIASECGIPLCLSAGLLTFEELSSLREAGISRYHCNLETAPSYFPSLCTTHTQDQKLKTLSAARQAGMAICSGGIIGMGETMEQRIELAFVLKETGADSVPVNILSPIAGTPLGDMPLIPEDEIIRTVALFRLIMPGVYLRFAGGRARLSEETLLTAMRAGINAAITGDMLTTVGSDMETDRRRIISCGYTLY